MAYEWERDEWKSAVQAMTEVERAITEDAGRLTVGDKSDALEELAEEDDDE